MVVDNLETVWSRTFCFLCLTQLLAYAHHALLTPTLPLYMTHLGGSPFLVGLMLAAFSATSVLSRPLMGYWADGWSVVGVLACGAILLGLTILLSLIPRTEVILLANALRGIAWAGFNTGGYTLLAHIAPPNRRGEASGYYSGFQTSTTVLFPALALWLIDSPFGGFNTVFLISAVLALVAGSIGLAFPHPTSQTTSFSYPHAGGKQPRPGASGFIDRGVLLPSVLFLCLTLALPAVSGFLVLYAHEVGIENIGWYFVGGGTVSLLVRPILGWLSDRVGRGRSVAAGFAFEVAGVLLIVVAPNLAVLVIAGIFYMVGFAIGTTTVMALAMDRADPQRRGAAMATFSMAFQIGMGSGAIIAGAVVQIAGYSGMFLTVTALVAVGLLLTAMNWRTLK
ncbi:MAG: MFS transporter [Dehalococcoidia bacterium]